MTPENADAQDVSALSDLSDLSFDPDNFAVWDTEEPWSRAEVDEVVTTLRAETERLREELRVADEELSDLLRNSGDGAGDDQADYGSSALEREQELSMVNNTRDLLGQNTNALERIVAGSYGTCEQCGAAIGKARLRAFPRATLCVSCKQREERR